jgi:hypothetical protein
MQMIQRHLFGFLRFAAVLVAAGYFMGRPLAAVILGPSLLEMPFPEGNDAAAWLLAAVVLALALYIVVEKVRARPS